jgi:Ca-activated chloride channel family protein
MSLQFQYPWVLGLIWMAPVAGILWHVMMIRRPAGKGLISPAMTARLAPAPSPMRQRWQMVLMVAGLLCGLIAAARPQWGTREETVYQRGRDLLIVLDVSRSMLATDVHPSRLGRAKVDLLDLIRQLRGDRVGLLVFRGRPLLLCPLTTDYGFFTQILEGTGVDSAPAGETDIGDALLEAIKSLEGQEGSHQAIILVSDGEDLAGKMDPAITKAREGRIPIFTVGFGSSEGTQVPSPLGKKEFLSYQDQRVLSKLNNELMREIAEKTGGAYVPVGLANVKLGDLYRDHLSRIAARDLEESVQHRYIERYQLFLLVAVLCFLTACFLSRGQRLSRSILPVTRAVPLKQLMLCLLFGAGITASTQAMTNVESSVLSTNTPPGREGARYAQRLYLLGKYREAAAAYQFAARTAAQASRDDYLYNAGCAHYKAGDFEQAAEVFRSLGGLEGNEGLAAAYNLGCSLFQQASVPPAKETGAPDPEALEARVQALKQSAAAFQKSLRLAPDDNAGRQNLGVVAGMMNEAVEQSKIARLMAKYGSTPPGALADRMLQQQRKLIHAIPIVFTNDSPRLIDQLEQLGVEQDDTADLMIPLKGKLLQALSQAQSAGTVTNAQQNIAQLNAFAESIRDRMQASSTALRDLDRNALNDAARAEAATYTLWKGVAGPDQLLREDIQRQTNAMAVTEVRPATPPENWTQAVLSGQNEALELTSLFGQRFEASVPPEGMSAPAAAPGSQPAGSETNAPEKLITPETRRKILDLTAQAKALQQSAVAQLNSQPETSLDSQRKAYAVLKEIEKLLPKEKQPQQNQKENKPDQKQDPQGQKPPPPKEEPKQQPEPKPQEPKKDQMSPEDVKRMLEKAMQREKEHEQEKRERDAYRPLSSGERDW